mgnify:CR=1 FL=1
MLIFEAIQRSDLQYVQTYLESNESVHIRNERGSTPLHEAVFENNVDIVRLLLTYGAPVNIVDEFGNTPLHIACMIGNQKAAQMLLANGAEIDVVSEARSWTTLMLALNENDTAMADWLISQGANLNHVDQDQGWTPLLIACDLGLSDFTLKLIEKGSHVNATIKDGDAKGRSAIHLLSYYGEVEAIKALIDQGVDVDLMPEGGGLSALHWSVYNNHYQLMKFLVEHQADVNIQASGFYLNRAPLHYAVSSLRLDMAKYLLNYGADPLLEDAEGLSPVRMAFLRAQSNGKEEHKQLLAMLENYI